MVFKVDVVAYLLIWPYKDVVAYGESETFKRTDLDEQLCFL